MSNKKGLIMGLANDKSIAFGIAKVLDDNGAKLAISYQNEVLEKRVKPLSETFKQTPYLFECDVSNAEQMKASFAKLEAEFGKLDFVVHAIAFSDRNELKGRTIDTGLENFTNTMQISCYSFLKVCTFTAPLLNENASIIALTYMGSSRVFPNYNIMGVAKAALESAVRYAAKDLGAQKVRVNAISAGPIKTLASAGIADFKKMLHVNEQTSPLHKNVTQEEVGNVALFLASDLSAAVTGSIVYADAGYNIMGMNENCV